MTRADITFTSGGLRCAAWLYLPEDAAEPGACVVMAHGFGGTRADAIPAFAERFVGAGLAALVFDYRHFGDSEGEPRQLLDIGLQLEDWTAAIACARTRPEVDETRIALWGSSFSGGHVVPTAVRDGHVQAVISQGPFADGLKQMGSFPFSMNLKMTVHGLRDQIRAVLGRAPHYVPVVGPPGGRGPAVAGLRRRLPRDRGRGVAMAQRVHTARDAARRRVPARSGWAPSCRVRGWSASRSVTI